MEDFLTIFLGIAFLVALFFLSYYLSKRAKNKPFLSRQSRFMKQIDRIALSNDKWIEMIELEDEILVIGVTQNSMNLISKYPKDKFNLEDKEQNQQGFGNVLDNYIAKMRRKAEKRNDDE